MLIMDEEYLSINAVLGLDGVDWYDDIAIICLIMIVNSQQWNLHR